MNDLISRQAVMEEFARHDCTNGEVPYFTGKDVQEILKVIPSAEPKGTWKRKGAYGESDMQEAYAMGLRDAKTGGTSSAKPAHGEWNRLSNDTFNCILCGRTFIVIQGEDAMNYCPNCGARMVGDTE